MPLVACFTEGKTLSTHICHSQREDYLWAGNNTEISSLSKLKMTVPKHVRRNLLTHVRGTPELRQGVRLCLAGHSCDLLSDWQLPSAAADCAPVRRPDRLGGRSTKAQRGRARRGPPCPSPFRPPAPSLRPLPPRSALSAAVAPSRAS